jgi:hypothetical protein
MAVSYTCPNPDCGVTLKTAAPIPAGKQVKCPKCSRMFVPVPDEGPPAAPAAGPGTFKFADDDPKKKPDGAKPPPPKPEPPAKKPVEDDDEDAESVKRGYGVVKDTPEELEAEKKNKVKFGEVSDKHKRSARGPAMALLVMPANLMTAFGLAAGVAGLAMFVWGMWPIVFNDAPPGDEEVEDAIVTMLLGLMTFGWGAFVCFGASMMQELGSYLWAMAGAVMAVPFLVGIYAIVMLQDPKVKAGFEETEGALDGDDEDKKDEDDDEEEDEEDDDEDDDDDD